NVAGRNMTGSRFRELSFRRQTCLAVSVQSEEDDAQQLPDRNGRRAWRSLRSVRFGQHSIGGGAVARGANKHSAKDTGTGAAPRRPRRISIPAPSGTAPSPVDPTPADTGWPTSGLEELGNHPEARADAGKELPEQASAES